VVPVRSFEEGRFLFLATAGGTVKKVELTAFANPRRGGIIAINLSEGDRLVGVELTGGKDEVVLATSNGQAVRFSEEDVRGMGRSAAGVRGARLKKQDKLVSLVVPGGEAMLLTICENGYGKRSPIDAYRLIKRGGGGVININTSDRNGPVVACMAVRDDDEVMIITAAGQVVRTPVEDIRVTGRNAQGVRVMTLAGTDRISSVAHLAKEEEAAEAEAGARAASAGKQEEMVIDLEPSEEEKAAARAEEDAIQKEIEERSKEEERYISGRFDSDAGA
jgi:DNA gyrase subunit A